MLSSPKHPNAISARRNYLIHLHSEHIFTIFLLYIITVCPFDALSKAIISHNMPKMYTVLSRPNKKHSYFKLLCALIPQKSYFVLINLRRWAEKVKRNRSSLSQTEYRPHRHEQGSNGREGGEGGWKGWDRSQRLINIIGFSMLPMGLAGPGPAGTCVWGGGWGGCQHWLPKRAKQVGPHWANNAPVLGFASLAKG